MKISRRIGIILLCLLLIAPSVSVAAPRPQGSAYMLEGRTLIISVYIEEADAEWKSAERKHTREAVALAAEYLEAQAKAQGKTSELLYDAADLRYSIEYEGAFQDSRQSDERFYKTMRELIYKQIPLDELLERYQTDSYCFLCMLPEAGVAYALPYYSNFPANEYDELCVVYLYDSDLPDHTYESVPIYAHELSHLFGAIDLYQANQSDGVTEALVEYVETTYPEELMFNTYETDGSSSDTGISQMFSDITLYMLGLIDEPPVIALFPSVRQKDVASFFDREQNDGDDSDETDEADDAWDSLWGELFSDEDEPSEPAPTDTPAPTYAPGSLLDGLGLGKEDESSEPVPTDTPAPTYAPGSLLDGLGLGGEPSVDDPSINADISAGFVLWDDLQDPDATPAPDEAGEPMVGSIFDFSTP